MDVLSPDGTNARSAGQRTDQRATSSIRVLVAWTRGEWTKTVTSSDCTCPLCVLRQVSDLVLIDPIPEDVFEEEQWKDYW